MIKKTVTALALAMILVLGASSAFAQLPNFGAIPPEAMKELANEPPMTQADIDIYLKVLPELGKAMQDPSAVEKIQKSSGLSEARLGLVLTKVSLAQAMSLGMTLEQLNAGSLPDAMKPTDADVELVKKNMDKINEAMVQMQQSMQKQ